MRTLTAAAMLFLFLGTGCYTQIYVEPDAPETLASVPSPTPDPPKNPPRPPFPPIDDPIIIVPPPPPPVVIILVPTTPAAPSEPMPIRHSGTQRPSDDQREERSSRTTSLPTRGR